MAKRYRISLALVLLLAAGVASAQDAKTVIQNAQKGARRCELNPILRHGRQAGWTELESDQPLASHGDNQLYPNH